MKDDKIVETAISVISGCAAEVLRLKEDTARAVNTLNTVFDNQFQKLLRNEMLKDIGVFDIMYQENLNCFKELEMYIQAGKERIKEIQQETIPSLQAEAAASGNPMDAQLVKDFQDTVDRFEKKIYDLELSRAISIQSAPQIKLIQNNDRVLVDKIQPAILNTIPIWKSQFVIALGLSNQQRVLKMQQEITETTMKNAELLKINTVETAKESNRGIVDIETLQKVNENLLTTISLKINVDIIIGWCYFSQ